jgi:hypothetical protein
MKTDLTTPCPDCPFRTDVNPYLRKERVHEICESIIDRQETFSCHKTIEHDYDDEGEEIVNQEEAQHCAGAMILLEKLESPNQWMRWMERIGFYDHEKLAMDAPVFDTVEDMVNAQES